MRRSRFSDEQIVAIVREAESGTRISELARRHGVSKNTIGRWRTKSHGLELRSLPLFQSSCSHYSPRTLGVFQG